MTSSERSKAGKKRLVGSRGRKRSSSSVVGCTTSLLIALVLGGFTEQAFAAPAVKPKFGVMDLSSSKAVKGMSPLKAPAAIDFKALKTSKITLRLLAPKAVSRVEFYVNNVLVTTDSAAPFTLTSGSEAWTPSNGNVTVKALSFAKTAALKKTKVKATVAGEQVFASSSIRIRIKNSTGAGGGVPTPKPTVVPTKPPTVVPTEVPDDDDNPVPTPVATASPSTVPTSAPTSQPTTVPTNPPATPRPSSSATPSSVGAIPWSSNFPTSGAVTIPAGKTVVIDVANLNLASLTIDGTVVCGQLDQELSARWIMVNATGRFECGTETVPHAKKFTVTLTGAPSDENIREMGTKLFGTIGGVISLHGATVNKVAWTKLGKDAAVGATSMELSENSSWTPGDMIVVATSDEDQNHAERLTVTSVSGKVVNFTPALKYQHSAKIFPVAGKNIDMRAEVGLLTRNILIKGDDASVAAKFGGHMMFMGTGQVQFDGVELTKMGQFDRLGRYPIHFHFMNDKCDSCYVRNVSIHDTVQRGIVVHHTNNILVQDNVVYNTVGHNIIAEDVGTVDNIYDHNLALVNVGAKFTAATLKDQNEVLVSNFWFKSKRNRVTNNSAAGSFTNGFFYDEVASLTDEIYFHNNTVHAAMQKEVPGANLDVSRSAGIMVRICNDKMPAQANFVDTTSYHNPIGFWGEDCELGFEGGGNGIEGGGEEKEFGNAHFHLKGFMSIDDSFASVFGSGEAPVKIVDSIFGTTDGKSSVKAVSVQYVADNILENPTFVNLKNAFFGNDIFMDTQCIFTISNVKLINTSPSIITQPADCILRALDSSVIPQGAYTGQNGSDRALSLEQNYASGSECVQERGSWKCPIGNLYGEMNVYNGIGFESGYFSSNNYLLRSDGVRHNDPVRGIVHRLLMNSKYTYYLENIPSGNTFSLKAGVNLRDSITGTPVSDLNGPGATRVALSMTLSKSPTKVERRGRTSSNAVTAASSMSDFLANKSTKFFYDSGAKKLWIGAGSFDLMVITK